MDCNFTARSRNNIFVSIFCAVTPCFPFLWLSQQCCWWIMPPTSLSLWFWNSSDCLLPIPLLFSPFMNSHALFYCIIHFDFLNILTIRRNYSSLAMFCLNLNVAVPFYASLTRNQKSMNFSHNNLLVEYRISRPHL